MNDNLDDRIDAAELLHESGEAAEAIRSLRALLQEAPDDLRCRGTLANMLSDAGEIDEAASILECLVQEHPEDAYVYINYAIVLDRMDRGNAALHHFSRAVEIDPNKIDFRTSEIRALLLLDRVEDAEHRLMDLDQQCEPNGEEWQQLGSLFGQAGHLEAAKQCLLVALEETPERAETLADLATTYSALGELDEAERYIKRSLAINPDDPISMCTRGLIEENRGRLVAALEWYRQAASVEPPYERAREEVVRIEAVLRAGGSNLS